MSLRGVLRAGHVAIRVTDLDAAVTHYTDFIGLIETDRDDLGRVYLRAWDEHDHHSVVLREADAPGMDYMGFKVHSDEAMNNLANDITAFGCHVEMACGQLRMSKSCQS